MVPAGFVTAKGQTRSPPYASLVLGRRHLSHILDCFSNGCFRNSHPGGAVGLGNQIRCLWGTQSDSLKDQISSVAIEADHTKVNTFSCQVLVDTVAARQHPLT